ncbi:MAG: Gfo/Idh/MocA family oxidoreductase [Planctomycetia bacterium]|nr:Gfo/Idh/MocA family oxidoreductase [Planctomycetia bacterium]
MHAQQPLSRRRFLGHAAGALTATALIPSAAFARQRRPGPNDRIRIGVIGVGVRGKYLIANLPETAQVVALCDCALSRGASALEPKGEFAAPLAKFCETDAKHCATHQDYRRMLERDGEKLDAVMIATPDHHHILAAMLACQAGLDVYLEKPLSLTIAEGRALVRAVKRHGTLLQVGSQQRTMEFNRFGCDFLRRGGLGKISRVELPAFPGPMPIGDVTEEPTPEGLSWDLFCGPTELLPHNQKLWVKDEFEIDGVLWRGWDLFRNYSGHLMTNWGAHSVDMVQLALGMDGTGPVEVRPLVDGHSGEMRRCPVAMRYAAGTELHFTPSVDRIVFHGEKGVLRMRRNDFEVDPPELVADAPDPVAKEKWVGAGHVARPHIENWLACLASRKTPNAPVEADHRTVTICHLANIARELRRPLRWDPAKEVFAGDDEANRLLDRPRRKGFELPEA